jgi:hypothetical protein
VLSQRQALKGELLDKSYALRKKKLGPDFRRDDEEGKVRDASNTRHAVAKLLRVYHPPPKMIKKGGSKAEPSGRGNNLYNKLKP